MFLFLFITILALSFLVNYKVYRLNISTVAGAPIMAIGITMKSIFPEDFIYPYVSDVLFYTIVIISYWVMIQYIFDLRRGVFYSSHIEGPVSSFSIGTWIAATSIMIILLSDRQFQLPFPLLFVINLFLWILYVGWIGRNYRFIFKDFKKYIAHFHGGLLLPCVATQSIVISGYNVFGPTFPTAYANILLIMGFLFYLVGLGLILFRYLHIRSTDLTKSWTNTNCIVHGAMSITGVSFTLAHSKAYFIMDVMWIVTFTLFLIVEMIEIFRASQRVKQLGWKQGLFVYSPTQWARIFTFGMFLFFTERMLLGNHSQVEFLQNGVFFLLPILIVILILNEVFLFSSKFYQDMTNKKSPIRLPNHENSRSFPQ